MILMLAIAGCATASPTAEAGDATPTSTSSEVEAVPKPDLVVSRIYIEMEGRTEACVEEYTPYEIRVIVKNVGEASSPPFSLELNGTVQSSDDILAAGETATLHFPRIAADGSYVANVDADQRIEELNEANNSGSYLTPTPTPPPICTPTA